MLTCADTVRRSDAVQRAFAEAERSNAAYEWIDLIEPLVETPVLQAFGFDDAADPLMMHNARQALRNMANTHPELRDRAHWLRYNRAAPCPLKIGERVPEVHVVDPQTLLDRAFRPCLAPCVRARVVFGASIT